MAKRGRKIDVYTSEVLSALVEKMEKYIRETRIPVLAEFAYKNNLHRSELYKHPELSDAIKRLKDKKEAQLELLGLSGDINSSMAIFSLKQLGWSDKQEIEHSGSIENKVSKMTKEEREQRKAELLKKLQK